MTAVNRQLQQGVPNRLLGHAKSSGPQVSVEVKLVVSTKIKEGYKFVTTTQVYTSLSFLAPILVLAFLI